MWLFQIYAALAAVTTVLWWYIWRTDAS